MSNDNMDTTDGERGIESARSQMQPPRLAEADDRPAEILLDVLADDRRRYVLSYVRNSPHGVVSRGEIASSLGSALSDESSSEQIAIALHHAHLPRLDDIGLLDYDPRNATVEYRCNPLVERYLDAIDDRESWPE